MANVVRHISLEDIETLANREFPEAYRTLPHPDTLQFSKITVPSSTGEPFPFVCIRIGRGNITTNDPKAESNSLDLFARVAIYKILWAGGIRVGGDVLYGTLDRMNERDWKLLPPENAVMMQPFAAVLVPAPPSFSIPLCNRLDSLVLFYALISKHIEKIDQYFVSWTEFTRRFKWVCQRYHWVAHESLDNSAHKTATPTQTASTNMPGGKGEGPRGGQLVRENPLRPLAKFDNLEPHPKSRESGISKSSKATEDQGPPLKKPNSLDNRTQVNQQEPTAPIINRGIAARNEPGTDYARDTLQITAKLLRIQKDTSFISALANKMEVTVSDQRKEIAELKATVAKATELNGAAEEKAQRMTREFGSLIASIATEREKRELAEKKAMDLEEELEEMRRNIRRQLKRKQSQIHTEVKTEPE